MSEHTESRQEETQPPKALAQIALSLSGGGVRALGFHLGVFSMLDRLGILKNLTIVSTVSGGSMAGIGYSLAQHFGRSYQDFFDDFYEFLPELNILEQLLDRVTRRDAPSPSGRRDLITALANVYDECYFKRFFGQYVNGEEITFDILMNQEGQGHLTDMIFNATEFKSGTAFRFQVSDFRCLIGNGNIAVCRKHAAMIRIADIMAASSCIPAGMEPLFFPDDFHWPDDGTPGLWRKCKRPTKDDIARSIAENTDTGEPYFTLMDGGVYDNQGITSTLLALNRAQKDDRSKDDHVCGASSHDRDDPPGPKEWANWMSGRIREYTKQEHVQVRDEDLDLLIVSDTPVKRASFYPKIPMPEQNVHEELTRLSRVGHKEPSWVQRIKLGQLSGLAWIVLALLSFSAGITVLEFFVHMKSGWEGVPFGKAGFMSFHMIIPFILILITAGVLMVYKVNKAKGIKAMTDLIPNWKRKPGSYIGKLRLGDVFRMGALRAGSVSALTSNIYMNRIRGLGYATAYSRPDLQGKIVSNEIFSLNERHDATDGFHTMLKDIGLWPPPPEMFRITSTAANMATKLWIDPREGDPMDDLDYLVASGQATICYNMMKFMWEQCSDGEGKFRGGTGPVFEQAVNEWRKLYNDPVSLLYDRKERSRLPKLQGQAAKRKAQAA